MPPPGQNTAAIRALEALSVVVMNINAGRSESFGGVMDALHEVKRHLEEEL